MSEVDEPRLDAEEERRLGAALFNRVWTLLEMKDRTPAQDEAMVNAAHASVHHWRESGLARPENDARGEWQLSRVYAVIGRSEPALHHARRCLEICEANGIGDFDLAFAYEALARAYWAASDESAAGRYASLARDAGERIEEDEDRELFERDLATLSFPPPASEADELSMTHTREPPGVGTSIAPWLSVADASRALDYYKAAFGADEPYRLDDETGGVAVARLSIDGADFWIQRDPDSSPGAAAGVLPVRMVLTVDDPDSMFERAVAAGASVVAPVRDEHGWRVGRIADPFGHHWEIARPFD